MPTDRVLAKIQDLRYEMLSMIHDEGEAEPVSSRYVLSQCEQLLALLPCETEPPRYCPTCGGLIGTCSGVFGCVDATKPPPTPEQETL